MTASQTAAFNTSATIAVNIARRMLEADPSLRDFTDHQLACQRIREHGFCPPENLQQPAIVLSAPLSFIDDPEFAEQISASRLEEFCLNFFSIPPARRAEIWNELDKQLVRMPQLHWRLQALKEGLGIEYPPQDLGGPAASLARELCRILILPPRAARKALDEVCVKAYKKDSGRELGDALNVLNCILPAIATLRPAATLPDRLRRLRLHAQERVLNETRVAHKKAQPREFRLDVVVAVVVAFAAIFVRSWIRNDSKENSQWSMSDDKSLIGSTGLPRHLETAPPSLEKMMSEGKLKLTKEFKDSLLKAMNRPISPPAKPDSEFSTPTLTEFDTTQNENPEHKNDIIDQDWLDEQHDLFIRKPDADRRDVPLYKSEFFGDESDEFSRIPQPSAIPSFGTSTPVQKLISQPRTVEEDQAFERNEIDALWESEDE